MDAIGSGCWGCMLFRFSPASFAFVGHEHCASLFGVLCVCVSARVYAQSFIVYGICLASGVINGL